MDKKSLTQRQLKKLLHYDPDTGIFTWIVGDHWQRIQGKRAGCLNKRGYRFIGICGKRITEHRLAFLYMTGETPAIVDHINRIKIDNRWSNLRATNKRLNAANMVRENRFGKGVFMRPSGRFAAQITINGKVSPLGTFDSAEEAHAAYRKAAKKHFGEFARF